ncbi:MAG: hypothetical protein UR26_C0004G0024 [candidate division TM6 bacterium GW2011_GWF2_32_72]|nr:MAG: hypothetical protein UR26_C0004G0024 [candidate division TM6 bacterium GW2011_GWF2_32_72]
MQNKKRLDVFLQELHPQYSRRQIQSWILQGKVTVNDKKETKAGTQIKEKDKVELILDEPKFVSRAGFKLEGALDYFNVDVAGMTVLDSGLSTGGFTDCLLQRGAKKVYGVDVGTCQVHEKIACDERVVVMEKTNLKDLVLNEKVDLVTLDLSFISVLKVLQVVFNVLKENGSLIILIKPQFEARKDQIGKGGIVRDDKVRDAIVQNTIAGIKEFGFEFFGLIESPITGATGNIEYLAYFKKS